MKMNHIIFDKEEFKKWLESLNTESERYFELDEENNVVSDYFGKNKIVVKAGFIINSINLPRNPTNERKSRTKSETWIKRKWTF